MQRQDAKETMAQTNGERFLKKKRKKERGGKKRQEITFRQKMEGRRKEH